MAKISIVPACADDINAICELLAALFSQEAEFTADHENQQRAVSEIIASPAKGHILMLKRDATVLGMVSLLYLPSTALGGRVAILEDMIIDAHYRRQGLGTELLQATIAFARREGCQRVTLLTDGNNQAAQSFYQKQGFSTSAMLPMRLLLAEDSRNG
jgi:ribosomal protein S18 acetylase RimI-like enzyme